MNITEYIPTEQLRPYIKAYKIIESTEGMVNRVLPDTSFVMAFRLVGEISYLEESETSILPSATISGLRKSARLINYAPHTSALIVLFRETGLSRFFSHPFYELSGKSVRLDTVLPGLEIPILEKRLIETNSNTNRISIIEQFLLSKLVDSKTDRLVTEAITKIYANRGLLRITALADTLSISQDAFEKRFRKVTGSTPKQFAFIVRMKSVIHQTPSSFLDLALANGYYDQPHFNKDFKRFTGQRPADFFKSPSYW